MAEGGHFLDNLIDGFMTDLLSIKGVCRTELASKWASFGGLYDIGKILTVCQSYPLRQRRSRHIGFRIRFVNRLQTALFRIFE